MTSEDGAGFSLFGDDRPIIAWSLWERVRRLGGLATLCSVPTVGGALLVADIPGERAFSQVTPGGAVPLWPSIMFAAVLCPLAGLAIALLLPLYRYRYGGAAVGALVAIICLGVAGALFGRNADVTSFERWQGLVGLIGLVAMSTALGAAARDEVLGTAKPTDGWSSPIE